MCVSLSHREEEMIEELDYGKWASRNPSKCICSGGWLLSDYDTYHRCPFHGQGVPHPEEDDAGFDYKQHSLTIYREAYRYFQEGAADLGVGKEAFSDFVKKFISMREPSKVQWVNAAEQVYADLHNTRLELRSKGMGFSCILKAAWEAEKEFQDTCERLHLNPEDEAFGPLAVERDSWYYR